MSKLKIFIEKGYIRFEAGVLDFRWSTIRLELGDDEYLQCLGASRIINGGVSNPRGFVLPNVDALVYFDMERIVLPEIVKKIDLIRRTERNIVLSQFIPRIFITSKDSQLEVIDVRCDELVLYDTLFNEYLSNVGHSRCSENYYLLKMGVCLN